MRVFVAGGTGAVGGHAIPALVQQGHTVTALARTPKKAATLAAQGATPVSVSLFDRSALAAAFAGHDTVANLATAIPPMRRWMSVRAWQHNDRVRTEGSAAVVDAALAADVGRVVQESVSMLYRDQGAGWVDEEAPHRRYPMAAATLPRRPTRTGSRRRAGPGSWCASGGSTGRRRPQRAAAGAGPSPPRPGPGAGGRLRVLDPRGGRGRAAALHAPAGRFNVVDDEPLTKRGYAEALARAAGKKDVAARAWLGWTSATGDEHPHTAALRGSRSVRLPSVMSTASCMNAFVHPMHRRSPVPVRVRTVPCSSLEGVLMLPAPDTWASPHNPGPER